MKTRQMIQVVGLSVVAVYLTSVFLFPGGFSTQCRADDCPVGPGGMANCNGDANGDGSLDISDAVRILNYLFVGGDAPVAFAACRQTPEECADLAFGRCIAGSYVHRAEQGNTVTMTFGANGSLVVSFGLGGTSYGTWWKTGTREITAVTVSFRKTAGALSHTIVRTYVSQFDEDCSTQTIDEHFEAFNFPTNPADPVFPPTGQPVFESDSHYTATKIKW